MGSTEQGGRTVTATAMCTDELEPGARVEWWRHVMSEAFVPLAVERLDTQRFSGTLRTDQIADLMVATLSSSAQRISRTAGLISLGDRELLQIAVGRQGGVQLEQDGRQTRLDPGDLVVYETARPFRWSFDGPWNACVFTLPRDLVALTAAESRLVTARRLSGQVGIGGVVSRFLRDLADNAGDIAVAQSRRVVADITDLVLTLVVDSLECGGRSGPRRALLIQVKDYIGRHLTDPGLNPTSVAAAHHISTRYLYTLFADEPTSVAGYIRGRRLRRCARDLIDPRLARQSIATVAVGAGFGDLRGFERAFKTAYGVTAGEYRALRTGTT